MAQILSAVCGLGRLRKRWNRWNYGEKQLLKNLVLKDPTWCCHALAKAVRLGLMSEVEIGLEESKNIRTAG